MLRHLLARSLLLAALLPAAGPGIAPAEAQARAQDRVKVVTTLPAYASIAEAVGGDRVTVSSIAAGDQDAHFVKAKPSYAVMLRDADLFVTTGLDLELWAPALVDKSGNRAIRDGEPGFVSASEGVPMMDLPESASRAGGDVHVYGNPHIHTSPLTAKIIAGNVAAGLERVDADGADAYRAGLERFRARIDRELYGDALLEILDAETLDPLAREGRLVAFLEGRELEGGPLLERLGGWLARAHRSFYGREIVAYHKNWIYFTTLFGLEVAAYVEPKPGIPPSARHVHDLIALMKADDIRVLLAASYFSEQKIDSIAERTGARAVVVPLGPREIDAEAYFELMEHWVGELEEAFE